MIITKKWTENNTLNMYIKDELAGIHNYYTASINL